MTPRQRQALAAARRRTAPAFDEAMIDSILFHLNRVHQLLAAAGWSPGPEDLEFHGGSIALAWLADPGHEPAMSGRAAYDFAYSWGYIEGQAHGATMTACEYVDALGIEPIAPEDHAAFDHPRALQTCGKCGSEFRGDCTHKR